MRVKRFFTFSLAKSTEGVFFLDINFQKTFKLKELAGHHKTKQTPILRPSTSAQNQSHSAGRECESEWIGFGGLCHEQGKQRSRLDDDNER